MTTTDYKTAPGVIVSTYADYRLHRHVTDNGAVEWHVTRMYGDMLALETATYDGTTAFYAAQIDIDNDRHDNGDILAAAARIKDAANAATMFTAIVDADAKIGPRPDKVDTYIADSPLRTRPPLARGASWTDIDRMCAALRKSGLTQVALIDKDGDILVWDRNTKGFGDYEIKPKYGPFTVIHGGK